MAKAKANISEVVNYNKNTIIIVVTIVVLAVVFMYFRDRQQKRDLQLERLDTQMEAMEEWPPQRQNRQMNNTTGQNGGKIL